MVVTLRRARFPYRIVVPVLVTLTGIVLTLFAWFSEQRQARLDRQRLFESTARSNLENLARRSRRSITDVREIAKYWQLYGLGAREAWEYQAAMFLSTHRGTVWISWVGRDSSDVRVVATDSLHWPLAEEIRQARAAIDQPGGRWDVNALPSNEGFYVAVPVRTPEDSLGMVLAAVRADSLVVATWSSLSSILAVDVRTPQGLPLDRVGQAAANLPESMVVRESFQFGTGELWQLEFRPTDAYFRPERRPVINYFLLSGILLSLALGALAFQFMRLREFSGALGRANQELDDRLRELSYADQRMREANAQLEMKVQQRTAQLNDAVEEISAYSHSTSHDLRGPIATIMNFAQVLEEDYSDQLGPEGMKYLKRMRASGSTATKLLDRLVQFMWVGRKVPERHALDMDDLARSAWREATNPYRNRFAKYFLPNGDEWYKAAYYEPTSGVYFDYPTGSNTMPTPVANGIAVGTAVYHQAFGQGPAVITDAGGLSPYGTIRPKGAMFGSGKKLAAKRSGIIRSRHSRWRLGCLLQRLVLHDCTVRPDPVRNGCHEQLSGFSRCRHDP